MHGRSLTHLHYTNPQTSRRHIQYSVLTRAAVEFQEASAWRLRLLNCMHLFLPSGGVEPWLAVAPGLCWHAQHLIESSVRHEDVFCSWMSAQGYINAAQCRSVHVGGAGNWCSALSQQLRIDNNKAANPVNRCHMQKKNSLSKMRSGPRTTNSYCIEVGVGSCNLLVPAPLFQIISLMCFICSAPLPSIQQV